MQIDWAKGDVIVADGVEVAHAHRSWFRDKAEVQIGTDMWEFRSAAWGRRTLHADQGGVTRMSARGSGVFTTTWTLDADGPLELRQPNLASSRLGLWRHGAQIGEVSHSGVFTNRPRLSVEVSLGTHEACFVLWVAFVEYLRRASAATS